MKPILFNTEMVQAILEGRKTQTRRVLAEKIYLDKEWGLDREPSLKDGKWYYDKQTAVDDSKRYEMRSKYQVGDILWVRETWAQVSSGIIEHKAGYKEAFTGSTEIDHIGNKIKWRPSIHMPREAARIFLRVTNVRVERLQEITVEGVMAEGLPADNEIRNPDPATHESIKNWNLQYARYLFHNLWDSTVKKQDLDKYGWNANPWVWVYEFERVSEDGCGEKNKA